MWHTHKLELNIGHAVAIMILLLQEEDRLQSKSCAAL